MPHFVIRADGSSRPGCRQLGASVGSVFGLARARAYAQRWAPKAERTSGCAEDKARARTETAELFVPDLLRGARLSSCNWDLGFRDQGFGLKHKQQTRNSKLDTKPPAVEMVTSPSCHVFEKHVFKRKAQQISGAQPPEEFVHAFPGLDVDGLRARERVEGVTSGSFRSH